MQIRRVRLGPGAIILIVLLIGSLVYVGLKRLGVVDTFLAKLNPDQGSAASLIPDRVTRPADDSRTVAPIQSTENGTKSVVPPDVIRVSEAPPAVSRGNDVRPEDVKRSELPASGAKAPQTTTDDPDVTIGIWTWQTVSGIIDAVGGPGKSGDYPDSALYQAGIKNTRLVVQNDTSEQIKALAAGQMQFVTTTGDQSAVDIAGANKLLRGNKAKAIWSSGYSWGEDCLIGPESWKTDPQLSRGAVIVTAVPYCDWNVTVDWAADNQIPINPDEQVYDPDAINFVNATDHIEAAQKFVQKGSVNLRNRSTGKTESHAINGVATWTPGDVMAVRGRPTIEYKGKTAKVQKIVSTKEYSYMMPQILFGNEDWLKQHRGYVTTLLRAIARSNERIKTDDAYLKNRIAGLNAITFNMEGKGPNFWYTYFNGAVEDGVALGGSRVNNVSEVRHLFGLDSGIPLGQSIFGITYLDHAKRLAKLMPERLPTYAPVDQVVDLSFIKDLTDEHSQTPVYQPEFKPEEHTGTVVKANYQIAFDSGASSIKESELPRLQEIRNLLVRATDTKIIVEGHTDNVGDVGLNLKLSQERAQSVWAWLKKSDPSGVNINEKRLEALEGYGSYRPLPGNQNRNKVEQAANRRVVIILK